MVELCGLLYPAALGYKILGQESSVTRLQRISYYTTVFSYHKAINLEENQKNFFLLIRKTLLNASKVKENI